MSEERYYDLELTARGAKFFLSLMENGFYAGFMQKIAEGRAPEGYKGVQMAVYLTDSVAKPIWARFKDNPNALFENAASYQLLARTSGSILIYLLEGSSGMQLSGPIR